MSEKTYQQEPFRPDQCLNCHFYEGEGQICQAEIDGTNERLLSSAPTNEIIEPCVYYAPMRPLGAPEPGSPTLSGVEKVDTPKADAQPENPEAVEPVGGVEPLEAPELPENPEAVESAGGVESLEPVGLPANQSGYQTGGETEPPSEPVLIEPSVFNLPESNQVISEAEAESALIVEPVPDGEPASVEQDPQAELVSEPSGEGEGNYGGLPELSEVLPEAVQEAPITPALAAAAGSVALVDGLPVENPKGDEARIHCHKCRTQNSALARRCQNCGANLLPAEGVRERIGLFLVAMLAVLLIGSVFYYFYILNPGSAPNLLFLNSFVLGGAATLGLLTALIQLFRKNPVYKKFEKRAKRHEILSPLQAVDDLSRAIEQAPEKEENRLRRLRAGIFESLGRKQDAGRDYLTLATSGRAFRSESEAFFILTGGDLETYLENRRNSLVDSLLSTDKAAAVGYCPKCKTAVVLDEEKRCREHPRKKGRNVVYVIPGDELDGRLAVLQSVEKGKPEVAHEITGLLESGEGQAVGYCIKCKTAVVLTPQRQCMAHPEAKVKWVQYTTPARIGEAKARIIKLQRRRKLASYRRFLLILSLLLIGFASVVLLDIDVAEILKQINTVLQGILRGG